MNLRRSAIAALATLMLLSAPLAAQVSSTDNSARVRQRTPISAAQQRLFNIQAELTSIYLNSYEMEEARRNVTAARMRLRAVRAHVVTKLQDSEQFAALREQINQTTARSRQLYETFPRNEKLIYQLATENMKLRTQISRMETDLLIESEAYYNAQVDLTAAIRAQKTAFDDAMNQVRGDPSYQAALNELRNLRAAAAGRRR
jgi:predicted  nucleic acid-binding Zn-ribbon protein